jgi:hypothetical protein
MVEKQETQQNNEDRAALSTDATTTPQLSIKDLKLVTGRSPNMRSNKIPDNMMGLEHVLSYRGGPVVVVYSGRMLITTAGCNLLMIDLNPDASLPIEGLWKAFGVSAKHTKSNYTQSFLKGHTEEVTMLEVKYDVIFHQALLLLLLLLFYSGFC